NNGTFFTILIVNKVTLILWLNNQFSRQTIKTFTFCFAVNKTIYNVFYSVFFQICFHYPLLAFKVLISKALLLTKILHIQSTICYHCKSYQFFIKPYGRKACAQILETT